MGVKEVESAKECLQILLSSEKKAALRAESALSNWKKVESLYHILVRSNFLTPIELAPFLLLLKALKVTAQASLETVNLCKESRKTAESHLIILTNKEPISAFCRSIDAILRKALEDETLDVFKLGEVLIAFGHFLSQLFASRGVSLVGQPDLRVGIKAEDLGEICVTNRFLFREHIQISCEYGRFLNIFDEGCLQIVSDWASSKSYDQANNDERERLLKNFDDLAKGKQAFFNLIDYNSPPLSHQATSEEVLACRPHILLVCLAGNNAFILSRALCSIKELLCSAKKLNIIKETPFASLELIKRQFEELEISLPQFVKAYSKHLNELEVLLKIPRELQPYSRYQDNFQTLSVCSVRLKNANCQLLECGKKARIQGLVSSHQPRFFRDNSDKLSKLGEEYVTHKIDENLFRERFFELYSDHSSRQNARRLNLLSCGTARGDKPFLSLKKDLDELQLSFS